ncbi:hypothetical protein GCM10027066_17430 [Dyella jejuensis]
MYVVQRMELMGFGFVLLALLAYWRARRLQQENKRGSIWLLLCLFLTVIGFEAKETAVLVPGYALLLELTVLRFTATRPSVQSAWKIFYIVGCALAMAAFAFYLLPHYASAQAYAGRDYTAWQRELTQLRVLPLYLSWIVLPLPDHLHFYYDSYIASTGWLHPISTLLGGLLLLTLLILAVAFRHRRPLLTVGISWFFVAHALTSSPVPLELVFEHRNYPALLGPLLAIADVLQWLTQRSRSMAPGIVGILATIAFAFLTILRALTWGSPLLLATTLAQTDPQSTRAALDMARRYVAMSGNNPSNPLYSLGIQELRRGATLTNDSILPEEGLLIQAANHPDPQLDPKLFWDSLERKLRDGHLIPDNYRTLFDLQQARIHGQIAIDAAQLSRSYDIAITRNPRRVSLHAQYAELASLALNDLPLAANQWCKVLDLEKSDPSYAGQLANYLIANQRYYEASAVIAEVERQDPQQAKNSAWQARLDKLSHASTTSVPSILATVAN